MIFAPAARVRRRSRLPRHDRCVKNGWTEVIMSKLNYGRHALDRGEDSRDAGHDGARAAIESFYHAYNSKSVEAIAQLIPPDESCTVYNPVGRTAHGHNGVVALYRSILRGPASVWVELTDVTEYGSPDDLLFVGREHGEFSRDGVTAPLSIRTTRLFHYYGAEYGWRQVHHHGSIDDAEQLAAYQRALHV
jgi:hypothetical protein